MKRIYAVALTIFILTATGCGPKKNIIKDPEFDSFFEKARLIMTKEEQSIYKHLPDHQSKQEFVREFWEKRDPSPNTEENENKSEFEERIAYANRWFREGTGSDTGWDTERGRILLQLGFPDRREFGDYSRTNPQTGALIGTKRYPMERWFYYRFQLYLVFVDMDGFGKLKLLKIPATLLTTLDMVKFTLDLRNKEELKRAFKFDARYQKDAILVEIPVKKLSFEEQGENMTSKFRIQIFVYRNYKKIDQISQEKTLTLPKKDILGQKKIEFKIPYTPKGKGFYYFDVVIEEVLTASRYRNFCDVKVK
jgi:GWxTD domain-containing protein